MADAMPNGRAAGAAGAPSGKALLEVSGLEAWYGESHVLHGVDLDVPAGQFLAVVGRSGCGKSTLLRLIQGLETPTGGRIDAGPDPAALLEQVDLTATAE